MDGGITIGRKGVGLSPFVQVFGPHVLDERISDGAFRTLMLLDLLEGADREGNHRLNLIAKIRNVDERTIRRHIQELEDARLIEIERSQGETNRILIVEPLDAYGRAAIGGFYKEVQKANKELWSDQSKTASGKATPDKNVRGTPDKNVRTPRTKMSSLKDPKSDANSSGEKDLRSQSETGVENRGVEEIEQSPIGVASPEATPHLLLQPGNETGPIEDETLQPKNVSNGEIASDGPGRLQDATGISKDQDQPGGPPSQGAGASAKAQPPVPGESQILSSGPSGRGAAQTVCAPFRSSRAGSQILVPGGDDEEQVPKQRKKKNVMYDPDRDPKDWASPDAVGYFIHMYRKAWPKEGAPDFNAKRDLSAVKGRIAWLKAESIGADMMKRVIDHLFSNWSDGLPARFGWASRPSLKLIENIGLFERLVREVQGGVPSGRVDDWKDKTPEDKERIRKYAEKDEIAARLIREGASLEDAEREAIRLAGL